MSPQEGVAERVIRHFERMHAPRAQRVSIHWLDGAKDIPPGRIGAVFEGDTVVASARFARAPLGRRAVLEVETVEGEVARQELVFPVATELQSTGGLSTLAQVAAAACLKSLYPKAGLEVALR